MGFSKYILEVAEPIYTIDKSNGVGFGNGCWTHFFFFFGEINQIGFGNLVTHFWGWKRSEEVVHDSNEVIRLWKTTDCSSPKRLDCPHEYCDVDVGNPETGELFCDVVDVVHIVDVEEVTFDGEVSSELHGRSAGRLHVAEQLLDVLDVVDVVFFCFLYWASMLRQASSSSSSSEEIMRGVGGR